VLTATRLAASGDAPQWEIVARAEGCIQPTDVLRCALPDRPVKRYRVLAATNDMAYPGDNQFTARVREEAE